jgi:hypothetical protein
MGSAWRTSFKFVDGLQLPTLSTWELSHGFSGPALLIVVADFWMF